MAAPSVRRPLPIPPSVVRKGSQDQNIRGLSSYIPSHPYYHPPEFAPSRSPFDINDETPITMLRGGMLLHQGFYDLLSMIPTPSPSRFPLFGWRQQPAVAGPRYEEHSTVNVGVDTVISSGYSPIRPVILKKYKRISKDIVSKPTGFIHLVHASDAEQAEALLTRWGPDGVGKLGDPHWARPIVDRIRQKNQEIAINEVVNALKPSQSSDLGGRRPVLQVMNGLSTATSSAWTTAAQENVGVSLLEGLPGHPGNSTTCSGGLKAHTEIREDEDNTELNCKETQTILSPRKPINPSLSTLERAVSARIFFENLYFALLRHPPSREQRRVAMEKDMMNLQLNELQKAQLRTRWYQNETEYLRERRRKIDASAFIKLKTIGHGAFGVVSLVKEQPTGRLYAMKQLRKTDMLRKGQEGHVRAERDILKAASLTNSASGAEWIVRLYYSFQDRDHLYLILEYMGGGDLLNLLIEKDIFDEGFTRFYVAEMILAIESCHKLGFIHRDIKPDNFLFDPNGHIKLSDFGLATDLHWAHDTKYYEQQRQHLLHKYGIDLEDTNGTMDGVNAKRMGRKEADLLMSGGQGSGGIFTWREKNSRKLAYSVCGTNSYMSPEVIRGHGYSFSCDWWSLGVIIFECLYGYPPFVSNSRHVTRQKILNWKQSLQFPSRPRVSHEGVNLMEQLLCEPEDRLGSQSSASISRPNSMVMNARRSSFMPMSSTAGNAGGADLIKAHPWFRGIDWLNIHRYTPPYRPELRDSADTRHFDSDIPAEPLAPANGAPIDATKDPLLRDEVHGADILKVRKALAFAGFTHKSPRVISYVQADKAFDSQPDTYGQQPHTRGRPPVWGADVMRKGRAISM